MNGINLKPLVAMVALSSCIAIPVSANAQDSIRTVYTKRANVKEFVRDVERQSNDFREMFEVRYKEGFISNFRRTDQARNAVQALDRAIEKVYKKSTAHKPRYLRDEVKVVLEKARDLDMMFAARDQILDTMHDDWTELKHSVNEMAELYDLPSLK